MLIRTSIFALTVLVGSSTAFTPSNNVRVNGNCVTSTQTNAEKHNTEAFLSEPSADDRRSFVTKVCEHFVSWWLFYFFRKIFTNTHARMHILCLRESIVPSCHIQLQAGTTVASAAVASATGTLGFPAKPAEAASTKMWKAVKLPFTETLYDIDFDT